MKSAVNAACLYIPLIILVLCGTVIGGLMQKQFVEDNKTGFKNIINAMSLTQSANNGSTAKKLASGINNFHNVRVTFIDKNGVTLGDSSGLTADFSFDGEIKSALKNGYSESFSGFFVLRATEAIKLSDGNIIRLYGEAYNPYLLYLILTFSLCIFLLLILSPYTSAEIYKKALNGYRYISEYLKSVEKGTDSKRQKYEQEDGPSPYVREIAESVSRIEQKLKELNFAKNRIEYLLNDMSEGLVVLDSQLKVVLLNDSAANYFDVKNNMVGQNLYKLTHLSVITDAIGNAIKGIHSSLDIECPADRNKILQLFISPVHAELQKDSGGAVILITDVTSVRKTEQIRSDFVANASHELKTPLTTIKGFAELIDSDIITEPGKIKHYLKLIKEESDRLILLINDILKLSELEAKALDSGISAISLRLIAEKAKESLNIQAREKNVTVTVEGDAGIYKANPDRMMQLFLNLMDNAIKYNKVNGNVNVRITQKKDSITIRVSDTGIGIPKEAQERVFERFYRVDKSRSRKLGGTGLGLSIVKHIVGLYDGILSLESEKDEGTAFIIILPIK